MNGRRLVLIVCAAALPQACGPRTATGAGNHATIWHRQPDGDWKVAVDIGNEDAAEA